MSKMYITEYGALGVLPNQLVVAAGLEPKVTGQVVSFTGTHGESAAFNTNTRFVMIHVDGIASILFSAAGTAATANSDDRLAANETRFYAVSPGLKVSAVTSS